MAVTTKSNKNIEITKDIMVDNVQVKQIRGVINTSNPENAVVTDYTNNQTCTKKIGQKVRAAASAAEDEIYAEQDAIIANLAGGKE